MTQTDRHTDRVLPDHAMARPRLGARRGSAVSRVGGQGRQGGRQGPADRGGHPLLQVQVRCGNTTNYWMVSMAGPDLTPGPELRLLLTAVTAAGLRYQCCHTLGRRSGTQFRLSLVTDT